MNPKKGKPLMEHYIKRYTEVEGKPPVMNRNKKVWAFADMYADLGDDAYAVIDYFIDNWENGYHDLDRLMYNYDDYLNEMNTEKLDRERMIRISKETAERVRNIGE